MRPNRIGVKAGWMKRAAILVGTHGRGSNMAALAAACARGDVPCVIAVVIGQRGDAPALQRARELAIPVAVERAQGEDYGDRLVAALRSASVDWVCLAGYMRLLPVEVLRAFPERVLNIHPALLPKFGGKGMYGERVHQAVIDAGEVESGCTVHRVDERYDEGEIVLQLRCPVLPGDTAATLAARVLELEHRGYAQALRQEIARHA